MDPRALVYFALGNFAIPFSVVREEPWHARSAPMTEIPDDVRETVEEEIGEEGLVILEHLAELGPTTDTVLAEELDAQTSTIRRNLYQLYEERIADYRENRDPENGWLTFVWSFTPREAKRELEEAREAAVEEIREEIERVKESQLFVCPDEHVRLEFAEAMDLEFHCPRCGVSVEREDTSERLADLREQLEALEQGTA